MTFLILPCISYIVLHEYLGYKFSKEVAFSFLRFKDKKVEFKAFRILLEVLDSFTALSKSSLITDHLGLVLYSFDVENNILSLLLRDRF